MVVISAGQICETNSLSCSSPVVFIDVFAEFVYKLLKTQIDLQYIIIRHSTE